MLNRPFYDDITLSESYGFDTLGFAKDLGCKTTEDLLKLCKVKDYEEIGLNDISYIYKELPYNFETDEQTLEEIEERIFDLEFDCKDLKEEYEEVVKIVRTFEEAFMFCCELTDDDVCYEILSKLKHRKLWCLSYLCNTDNIDFEMLLFLENDDIKIDYNKFYEDLTISVFEDDYFHVDMLQYGCYMRMYSVVERCLERGAEVFPENKYLKNRFDACILSIDCPIPEDHENLKEILLLLKKDFPEVGLKDVCSEEAYKVLCETFKDLDEWAN